MSETGTATSPEMLLVRFYGQASDGANLRAALTKVKGVHSVALEKSAATVNIDWRGGCKGLTILETTAAAAGLPAFVVNHAHVHVSIKPVVKGASTDMLWKEIHALSGVKGAVVNASLVQIHADLPLLDVEELRGALLKSGYEGELVTHVWAEVRLESGDAEKFGKDLLAVRGTLTAKREGSTVRIWSARLLTEDAIRKAAEKSGVSVARILYY